ncbi:RloB family protein [uncultured Winogradskyella sp.]|uniref:RloB family protein n=1 Tax=uncultured Winogradskyella sp. TaxID=395353 RepID=UPI00262851A5|nr:RloB family protein [uncultured Winogradskyella sp.]
MPPIKKENRKYKKGKPFRDARKFILICEGEREAEYFNFFDKKSQKLIVKTIAPVGENKGESAPNHLQNRASEYIEENGWENEFEDQLWFVLDVDRWKRASIEELYQLTEQTDNWHIGISNQCFEVWLYYHKEKTKVVPDNPTHMKQLLSDQVVGGYKIEDYAPDIETASVNAEKLDNNKLGYFPDVGITKLYVLGKEIVSLLKYEEGSLKL